MGTFYDCDILTTRRDTVTLAVEWGLVNGSKNHLARLDADPSNGGLRPKNDRPAHLEFGAPAFLVGIKVTLQSSA
jgi:hypothetical protein